MTRDIAKPIVTARSFDELPHTLVMMEVAALLYVTRSAAHVWVNSGKLPARKACGIWLVDKHDLLKFSERHDMRLFYFNVERSFGD